jgi:ATP-dependent DNA helicase RecQ
MLKRFDIRSDANKRLVYVAMTRAKQHLHIHLNEGYLDHIKVSGLTHQFDKGVYDSPDELVFHLGYTDVVLDHFLDKDEYFGQYTSGQKLIVDGGKIVDGHGNTLIRFSKDFFERLEPYYNRGYRLSKASVNYVVYWRKKDSEIETRIILPEIRFER